MSSSPARARCPQRLARLTLPPVCSSLTRSLPALRVAPVVAARAAPALPMLRAFSTRVFLANLNYQVAEKDLEDVLSKFGEVRQTPSEPPPARGVRPRMWMSSRAALRRQITEVRIVRDPMQRSKGFAFATFREQSAEHAHARTHASHALTPPPAGSLLAQVAPTPPARTAASTSWAAARASRSPSPAARMAPSAPSAASSRTLPRPPSDCATTTRVVTTAREVAAAPREAGRPNRCPPQRWPEQPAGEHALK
jgi:hypothetical protein